MFLDYCGYDSTQIKLKLKSYSLIFFYLYRLYFKRIVGTMMRRRTGLIALDELAELAKKNWPP